MATSITNTSVTTDNLTVDTDTISVDSTNNRVGIGTSSPSKPLHVSLPTGSGATPRATAVAVIDGNDNTQLDILGGASSILGINFGDSSDNDQARITCNTTPGSEDMAFTVNAGVRMTINANGAITTPDQPGCMIYCQSQDINWVAGTQILYGNNSATSSTSIKAWDTTNSFNMANSQYTAPVAGKYYVSFTANGVYTGNVPRAYVRVNGSDIGHGQHIRGNSTISGDLDNRTYAGIISLAANDIVTVYAAVGTWDTFGCNYFCMYKLS